MKMGAPIKGTGSPALLPGIRGSNPEEQECLQVALFVNIFGDNFGDRMSKRFITRIELTVPTRTKLTDVSHFNGMTQVAVLSRLVQWFATQPDTIQAAILGRYPAEIEKDVAKLILEQMQSEKSR